MAGNDADGQPDEPNWDLFQADLKVSKMIIKRPRPQVRFDIPVPPQPPRYRPSTGSRAEPVHLRLVDDSTAFIVDKLILPLEPFTEVGDPRQRRAYYIIGWPDLPAARPVVDCSNALDYVSPYAIEQWEHEDFLRREAEKEQADAETALAAVARAIAMEKGKDVPGTDILPDGKKKTGRKSKNARLQDARPPTPQLDSEQEELLAKRKQGPSLSTPQKRKSRIAQLDAEMEMDSLDHMDEDVVWDTEIRRQLERKDLREDAVSVVEARDDVGVPRTGTAASGLPSSSPTSSARLLPPGGIAPQSRGSAPPRASRPAHTSPLPHSMLQHQSSALAGPSRLAQIQKPISTTPIPLPPRPGFRSSGTMASLGRPSVVPSVEIRTPSAQGRAQASKPTTAALKPDPDAARAPPSSKPPHTSDAQYGGFTPTNSFTPVSGHFPRPPKRPVDEPPFAAGSNQGTTLTAKIKKERKKKAPKLSHPPKEPAAEPSAEPQAEEEYVVKRLEDDSVVEGIQYFKVRWEGDWPPEQNPTWEPQDNISAKLVKAYLKRKAEKAKNRKNMGKNVAGSSRSKPKEKHQSTLEQWASNLNYSSVSEAFEGQAELDQMNGKIYCDDDGAKDDEGLGGNGEEFLVVDKRKTEERDKVAAEKRKSLSSRFAAGFANLGPRKEF